MFDCLTKLGMSIRWSKTHLESSSLWIAIDSLSTLRFTMRQTWEPMILCYNLSFHSYNSLWTDSILNLRDSRPRASGRTMFTSSLRFCWTCATGFRQLSSPGSEAWSRLVTWSCYVQNGQLDEGRKVSINRSWTHDLFELCTHDDRPSSLFFQLCKSHAVWGMTVAEKLPKQIRTVQQILLDNITVLVDGKIYRKPW